MKREFKATAPPEPIGITRAWDRQNDLWTREGDDKWVYGIDMSRTWEDLVITFGPITVEVPDPMEVTEDMIYAVGNVMESRSIGADQDRDYWTARTVLEAAGFEVKDR